MDNLEQIINRVANTRDMSPQEDLDTTTPECERCNDQEYIIQNDNAYPCECRITKREKKKLESLFKSARIPQRFKGKTLDNFKSSRQLKAFKEAKSYLDNWAAIRKQGAGLIFVGPVGTGKSHLAFAILQGLLRQGVSGMAVTVPDLLEELRPKDQDDKREQRMQMLKGIDFLLLDDLGAQRNTDWVTERLFVIINARHADMLPTVITSNNYLEELDRHPGWQRITDRMQEMGKIVIMDGASYRRA